MRSISVKRSAGLTLLFSGFLAVSAIVRTEARPQSSSSAAQADANSVSINSDDVGGVVTSSKGPEAGVWVIAETTELPTKFRKIVVTDDRGRYLLPELPKANYKVWVRGYGLIDSGAVSATPGQHLSLRAVIAPDAKAAAQYYPANYWFSLLKAPPKSEFPMTVSTADSHAMNGATQQAGATRVIQTQAEWVSAIKCGACHQMGTKITREISPSMGAFDSSVEAWDYRLRVGQVRAGINGVSNLGREHTEALLADWTDRIAAGELPQVPPRPAGAERNLVITTWDIGTPTSFFHDLYTTDKRNPTVNGYGPVIAGDYSLGILAVVDPKRNADESIKVPIRDDPKMLTRQAQTMEHPSPYWGDELIFDESQRTEVKNIDAKGRLWMMTSFRKDDNPDWCKDGSSNTFAKYFPLKSSHRQIAHYDVKTKKFVLVNTCFNTHHGAFAEDKDDTFYVAGNDTALGWVKTRVLDETGDEQAAQGWCPAYYDVNGDGKFEKDVDRLITGGAGYYITYNPVDGSVWYTLPGTPGKLIRMDVGSNPPETCHAEAYEPPYNNPKAPGKLGYLPRGIDVDRNGLVWTGLAGSGQLASFDRTKCKVLTGPESFDPQHCVEGWTLYDVPGPQMKNITDGGSTDFLYGNWVDQFNTLGLGKDVPIATGTNSDSLLALMPDTHKWVVLRVPYPLGFYTRNLAGRIDDPNAGWKGRGLWAGNEVRNTWHQEGGKGMRSEAVHFQMRPDPLAK